MGWVTGQVYSQPAPAAQVYQQPAVQQQQYQQQQQMWQQQAQMQQQQWQQPQQQQWQPPPPPGPAPMHNAWVQYFNQQGAPYYYNEQTGETVWQLPPGVCARNAAPMQQGYGQMGQGGGYPGQSWY